MKQLTVITLIAMTLMTAKAQPLHRSNGVKDIHHFNTEEKNSRHSGQKKSDATTMTIYPNPAGSNLFVEIQTDAASNATLKLMDFLGKNIVSEDINLVEGLNKIKINVSELRGGTYFIKVEDDNYVRLVQRFTLQ